MEIIDNIPVFDHHEENMLEQDTGLGRQIDIPKYPD